MTTSGQVYETQIKTKGTDDSTEEIINVKIEYCGDIDGDGKDDVKVTLSLDPSSNSGTEDIIGVAFDIKDDAVSGLTIHDITNSGSTFTPTSGIKANEVGSGGQHDLDPGFNTSGGSTDAPYDAFVKFSDQGAGDGVVQSASFVISGAGDIDADTLLSNTDWLVRLQSTDGGEGSSKMVGTIDPPPCKPEEEKPGKIVGIKYEDCDGNGDTKGDLKPVSGWTVELYKDGQLVATTTTVDTGYYEFTNLEPGQYTVKEVMQDNWYNVNVTEKTVTVESDGTVQVDFVNTEYAKLSGYKYEDCNKDGKWGESEKGLEGWTIQLCDADGKPVLDKDGQPITTVTNSNGYYEFNGLKPGTYTTKEVLKDGWVQTDASEAAVLKSGGHDSEGNDFGNYKVPNPSMEVDKNVCSVKGGYYDESCGQWVVDSAGDCINYEIVLKNTGDVDIYNVKVEDYLENSKIDTKSMKLYGDDDKDGVLDVGETWTYKYSYKVTAADIKAAQKIVTEKTKVGFFTCYTKKCTGDLDIDNFVKVTGEAKGGVKLVEGDFETVKVACPCPNDGHNDPYGGSKAEILWNKYFGEDMVA